jgi:hypothetical protein
MHTIFSTFLFSEFQKTPNLLLLNQTSPKKLWVYGIKAHDKTHPHACATIMLYQTGAT